MKVVVLLGAPGAGKGTLAEGIKTRLGYTHVSTGDMLREEIKRSSELGRLADSYIRRGYLVPDDLIVRMVIGRLDAGGPGGRFLLDGFPRTLEQARMLDKALADRGAKVARVFLLDVPREVAIDRLAGRRICRKCGATFHIRNIPPRIPGVCDKCGGELYQRPDDSEATILNRLDVFKTQTEGLVAYYENCGLLERVDSSQHRDTTIALVAGRIGG